MQAQFLTTDYKSGAGVDMGLGTVPPYMTTAVKHGGHRSHKGHSRRSVHSDGSDSYVEMDEWIEETKSAKKKLSKRRRNSRSHPHRKHKQERNPIKHPPKLPIPTPVAAPYIEPMATGASKPTRATVPEPVFVTTSQEMSLGEFVSKHQQEFPVRVRVSRGFYGTSDRWSISEGELFNIHFVKYTKVVAATDGGQHYNIPINSAAEFANIYAPDQDFEVALKGYTFKTVRDIISQNNMPHIVRATEASGRPKVPESSVEKNEMLILKKVKKPIFGSHSLQCTNPITGQHKCLPATCAGNFKTQPLQVCLFLPEVIEHITLPEKFLIFINPDLSSDIPEDLFSTPITLSHCSIETSLVATQLDVSNTNDRTRQSLLEIPIDLDIGVELVTPREDEIKQLYTDTQTIYDNFTGSSIKKIPFNAASGDVNPNVSEAFTAHRRGKENIGIRLQQPPRFANTTAVRNPSHPHPPEPLEPVLSRKKSDKGSRYSKFYKYPPKETEGTILTMEEQIQGNWLEPYYIQLYNFFSCFKQDIYLLISSSTAASEDADFCTPSVAGAGGCHEN